MAFSALGETASGTHTWTISDIRNVCLGNSQTGCLYGPEFVVGKFWFQLHLHPNLNGWPEPSALFLLLLRCESSVEMLKLRTTLTIPELQFAGSIDTKDTVARWQCGFSPIESTELHAALLKYRGRDLNLIVRMDILEVGLPSCTSVRWLFPSFEELRQAYTSDPCIGGWHKRLSLPFDVHSNEFGMMTFRLDMHPNIDATGNFNVSFRLEQADPAVNQIVLHYELALEELPFRALSESISGSRAEWRQVLGLTGEPTDCSMLRKYSGPLTLRVQMTITACALVEKSEPPVWSDFVSADFRYLLMSAAGSKVPGEAEHPLADGHIDDFEGTCAWNVHNLRTFLLSYGVPETHVAVLDFSGEAEQIHPREALETFLGLHAETSKLVLYYSGHALENGSWCCRWRPPGQKYAADVVITPHEVYEMKGFLQANSSRVPLEVIIETCYSGCWCVAAKEARHQGRVLASCAPRSRSWARRDGSIFTDWLVGRGQFPKLTAVPGGMQVPWEYTRLATAGPLHQGSVGMAIRGPSFPSQMFASLTSPTKAGSLGSTGPTTIPSSPSRLSPDLATWSSPNPSPQSAF